MGRTSAARARLSAVRWRSRVGTVVAALVMGASGAWAALATAPIVNGAPTIDSPAVGALLVGANPITARTTCTVTLVGCRTILTAAHCVCAGTGADCQGPNAPPTGALFAYFAHAGVVAVEQVAVHPDFVFPVADVAVIRLAENVTGIAPLPIAAVAKPPFGSAATIVGFGWRNAMAHDSGLKRIGTVVTAPCALGIADATSVCWDFTGEGANTCEGDSGGPLLVDVGQGPMIAGVTSGGFSATCQPTDHSYDADVFVYRDWIATAAQGDLGTAACGGIGVIGNPGVLARAFTGDLGDVRPLSLHSLGVAPGTAELRVGFNAIESPATDFDLYVRGGAAPAAGAFDCSAAGLGQYGFCRIASPTPGSWYLRAERVRGAGLFQLVATTIGGDPSVCGNAIREPGEDCDGADVGTCTTGCNAACACIACSDTDLDVLQIALSPRLFLQATMGDAIGTYTAVDPATAGVTIELRDATHDLPIVIPPRDPGWVLVNPRRGKYRWRGGPGAPVRRLVFRVRPKSPTQWTVAAVGRGPAGSADLDFQTLTVRVLLGTRCAERRFHVVPTPAIPRP